MANAPPRPRRIQRLPMKKAVLLLIESESHEAQTVDVSNLGTRVQSQAVLSPGQLLEFIPSGNPEKPVRCLVIWTGEVGTDREGEAGLEFLGPQVPPT